jgi:hypothetical protein
MNTETWMACPLPDDTDEHDANHALEVASTMPAPPPEHYGLPLDESDFDLADSIPQSAIGSPITERNFADFHELDFEDD